MAPRHRHIPAPLTPAECDYLEQDLLIALTNAEDLGLDERASRLGQILDTLRTYSTITAQDQIFMSQFIDR